MTHKNWTHHKNLIRIFWLLFCFTLAVIVRVYKVGDIPYGIHIDEAGMGYDAWALQKYHVDRWLNRFPVYLINFEGGQSVLYAYLCALFIRIFGGGQWNVVLLRMPGIVINLAAYIAGLHVIGKVFEEKWKMFSAFLLAILPYFIMQSRFGLDCNLLVNMLTISLCLLCCALESNKIGMFVLTGILWGVTYYSYALSYIPNTLLLLLISLYLLIKNRQLFVRLLCMWITVGVIAFPLVLMIWVNQFDLVQTGIGFMTITKLPSYRAGEFIFHLSDVLQNSGIVLSSILTKDWIDYNAFDKYYTMYRISIPFIIVGLYDCTNQIIKNAKEKGSKIDYSLFLWSAFIIYFIFGCFLGGDYANVNKLNGIFFSQFFLLIWGIRKIYLLIEKKSVKYVNICMGLLCAVYVINFISFTHFYFVEYPKKIYPQFLFADTYEGVLDHLYEHDLRYEQVYVTSSYIYYLLSANSNPYEVDLRYNGTSNFDNFNFYFPGEIDPDAVYIVRETENNYIEILKESGLELQYTDGMYQCYYRD